MTTSLTINEGRLLARIINLAHRFGCSYTRVVAEYNGSTYETHIDFSGPAGALARLEAQLTKLIHDDKETFR